MQPSLSRFFTSIFFHSTACAIARSMLYGRLTHEVEESVLKQAEQVKWSSLGDVADVFACDLATCVCSLPLCL